MLKDIHFEKSEILVIFVALIVTITSGYLVFGPTEAQGKSPTEVVQP